MAGPPAAPAGPFPSVFTSLRGYRRSWFRGDLVAGLTVWAVLVPERYDSIDEAVAAAAELPAREERDR